MLNDATNPLLTIGAPVNEPVYSIMPVSDQTRAPVGAILADQSASSPWTIGGIGGSPLVPYDPANVVHAYGAPMPPEMFAMLTNHAPEVSAAEVAEAAKPADAAPSPVLGLGVIASLLKLAL